MITPATKPLITENERPNQLSMFKRYYITKVATAMRAALTLVPRPNEWSNSFIVAPSLVRTKKMPMSERKIPMAAIIIGAITARSCISPFIAKAVAPKAAVDNIEPQ